MNHTSLSRMHRPQRKHLPSFILFHDHDRDTLQMYITLLARRHEPQRGLCGHTPQRNEQGSRRRYQHNYQLELGRVGHPKSDDGVHIAARYVTIFRAIGRIIWIRYKSSQ